VIERYTLPEIGRIWTDDFKFETWLKIEIFACEARTLSGEIPEADLELIKGKAVFNTQRVLEIEETTKHDVIAFLTNVSENLGNESRHIHYGMTSSDVLDTALSYQMKMSGELIRKKLHELIEVLEKRAQEHKYTLCIGRTHGIHAEPTSMGLKFALWFEEAKRNLKRLDAAIDSISVGKISGAVGNFEHLPPSVEDYVCSKMELKPAPVSTQVIQRDRHAEYLSSLATLGASLEKIAVEIRHLQKTEVLEAEEYFSKGQKGSSAMPHKRNPIVSERIAGLARLLRANAHAGFENVALWHERDISHSSVERVIIPDSCIIAYYMLNLSVNLIKNLLIYPENMSRNIDLTRGLVYSQKVLLALTKKGATREKAYSLVQEPAMQVWADQSKSLKEILLESPGVKDFLNDGEIEEIFNSDELLKNIDAIFKRTVELQEH